MKRQIKHDSKPVILIGAGKCRIEDIEASRAYTDVIVAADGGADVIVANGSLPDLVIGDGDSISAATRDMIPTDRQHFSADQDTTDFEKGLAAIRAPLILALGFLGGRVDHELAVISAMRGACDRPILLIGEEDVVFIAPPRIKLDLPVGDRLSIFPLGEVRGQSEGLRWPIDHLTLAPGGQIATSNEVAGPVVLSFDGPDALLILPRAALHHCVETLLACDAYWPVPAG